MLSFIYIPIGVVPCFLDTHKGVESLAALVNSGGKCHFKDMKRHAPFLTCLLLAALLMGGIYYWKYGFARPETIVPVVFEPLTGAMADTAVNGIGKISPDDVSTSLPISTSVADIPMHFAPSAALDDNHSQDTDENAIMPLSRAGGARIIKFENNDLCFDGLCLIGVFSVSMDGKVDYDNPLFTIHAVDIQLSDKLTNGNPDLIVDYGPRGGKKRFEWQLDGQFPAYTDTGSAL